MTNAGRRIVKTGTGKTGDASPVSVVHVITRFDKGGSAENTYLTVRGLAPSRYRVSLVTGLAEESLLTPEETEAVGHNMTRLHASGIPITVLPSLVRRIAPWSDLRAFVSLWRLFHRLRPRIVHTHTSKAGLLGRWAAWLAGCPVIVHTPHGHVFWGYFNGALSRLFILLERWSARISDRLVMLTEEERDDHLRQHIAPPAKFTVIHSGVDFSAFPQGAMLRQAARRELGLAEGDFVVGTVGRLTAIKGQQHLVEALALLAPRIPRLFCVMVGEGELRETLMALAERLGVRERLLFTGWKPHVAGLLPAFDCFAFPSLNEGMGKAVVEAQYAGLAVVASDIGGIKNLLVPGENGLLVPPGCAAALADAIELLYRQPETRARLGQQARLAARNFSAEAMVDRIAHLYESLLSGKGRP